MLARTLRIALTVALGTVALTGCGSGPERAAGPAASPSAGSPAGSAGPGSGAGEDPGATGSGSQGAASGPGGGTAGSGGGGSQPPAGPGGTVPPVATLTPAAAKGPLPDPCRLLSAAQVAAALPGAGPGAAEASLSPDGQRACRWTSSAAGHGFVQVVVNHGDARRSAADSRASLGRLELIDLKGASFSYLAGQGWVAGAQVKSVFVQITLTPTNKAAVLRLATAAVAAA